MPAYPWLAEQPADIKALPAKIAVQRNYLGVPYPAWSHDEIRQSAMDQARKVAENLAPEVTQIPKGLFPDAAPNEKIPVERLAAKLSETKIVALIAYVQKLGTFEAVPVKTPGGEPKPGLPGRGLDVPDRTPAPPPPPPSANHKPDNTMSSLVKRLIEQDKLLEVMGALSFALVFVVFLMAIVRALSAPRVQIDRLAAMPLSDEKGDDHV